MDDRLAALVERARAAWPELAVPAARFRGYLEERIAAEPELAALHVEDLYLACGCVDGDLAAVTAFHATYQRQLRGFVARVDAPEVVLEEACQSVLRGLLVAEPGRLPRVASYSGRGPLGAFLRVAVVREAIRLAREAAGAVGEDDDLWDVPANVHDPELSYFKELYGGAFKTAFIEALAGLSLHDRTLLRRHLVDGLSIDRVATSFQIHRATAARWLARARAKLVSGTQRRLRERLGATEDELASILRLVESNVDLSARRLLAAG